MAKTSKYIEPAVKIGRTCIVCGQIFVLSHPKAPNMLCEDCQNALCEMIRKYKNEQQETGNTIREADM